MVEIQQRRFAVWVIFCFVTAAVVDESVAVEGFESADSVGRVETFAVEFLDLRFAVAADFETNPVSITNFSSTSMQPRIRMLFFRR